MKKYNIYAFADEASDSLDGQIAALVRGGFDGIEIRGVDGENISDITKDKAKEIKKRLDSAGLRVWSVGSPIGKVKISDDFESHIEKLKHTLEISDILGSKNIRIFSFYMPEGEDPDIYKDEVIERLGRMCETAKPHGIDLCHENERHIYGESAKRCDGLLRALPSLKGVFDPANFVMAGEDVRGAWELLGDRIKYLHIKDSTADGIVVPAGEGDGQIPYIVSEFAKGGGRDFTLEAHLWNFSGLSALENGNTNSIKHRKTYADADEAFDVAAEAMKNIITSEVL